MGPPSFKKYILVKALRFLSYPLCIFLILWIRYIDVSYAKSFESEYVEQLLRLVYEWDITLGVFLASVAVFAPKPQSTFLPDKYAKKVRRGILENIKEDVFGGHMRNERVTIFTESGPLRNKYYNLIRRVKYWASWLPFYSKSNWNMEDGQYLVIRERIGEDRRAKHNTRFYCHYRQEEKCEGIAAQSLRAGTVKDVSDLPDISNINLEKIRLLDERVTSEDVSDCELFKVKEYMKKSQISRLRTLKQISIPARHIWSSPIYNENGKIIGALVVDSYADETFLGDGFSEKMQPYIENLSQTYLNNPYKYYA